LAEQQASAKYANLPYPFREKRLVVAIDLDLVRIIDLTVAENLEKLSVTEEELREDWRKVQEQGFESFTQALGRALFEAKAKGLMARSARVENGITSFISLKINGAAAASVCRRHGNCAI